MRDLFEHGAAARKDLDAAEEVERLVTIPIDNQMNSVPKLVALRSISLFGLSQITLVFENGADADYVRSQVNQYRGVKEERSWIVQKLVRLYLPALDFAQRSRRLVYAVSLPKGYCIEWTGFFENEQRAVRRLAIIVPVTLLLIFFLLFTAFDSGRLAALILVNVFYAAAEGILALPLSGLNISVAALVGFVALFGISIQNRVILVARIRELLSLGRNQADAIREGAVSRFRPMVMTALMAMLGLLPAALSDGVGRRRPGPLRWSSLAGSSPTRC